MPPLARTESSRVSPHCSPHPGEDAQRVEAALAWLAAHFEEQPSLRDAARQVGLSEFHFQRLFSRWAGLSPKKYVQYLTLRRAKGILDASSSVLDAAYTAGLSGPGRLHDLFVCVDAVTPGEYKQRGEGLEIDYGFHASPFGECLILATSRGICGLAFTLANDRRATLAALGASWARARFTETPATTAPLVERIFTPPPETGGDDASPLRLYLHGTRFQIKVWEALLTIPTGTLTTYGDIARRIGQPGAARAVGHANATNPISYLIPCHRVIRRSGVLGGYRWGTGRKLAMLNREVLPFQRAE